MGTSAPNWRTPDAPPEHARAARDAPATAVAGKRLSRQRPGPATAAVAAAATATTPPARKPVVVCPTALRQRGLANGPHAPRPLLKAPNLKTDKGDNENGDDDASSRPALSRPQWPALLAAVALLFGRSGPLFWPQWPALDNLNPLSAPHRPPRPSRYALRRASCQAGQRDYKHKRACTMPGATSSGYDLPNSPGQALWIKAPLA